VIYLLGVFRVLRITNHGVLLNFPSEITLILNPEGTIKDIMDCVKKYDEVFDVPLKIIFTMNFLAKHIKDLKIMNLVTDWARRGIVLLPYHALRMGLKTIAEKYNILSIEYNDILPISEDLSVSLIQRENIFNNSRSGISDLGEILIAYRNNTILYVYISSSKCIMSKKVLYQSNEIPNIDLCLLSLDFEKTDLRISDFLDNLPYILGFEADYLILSGITESPKSENILSVDLCNEITFTRHFTKLCVVKR